MRGTYNSKLTIPPGRKAPGHCYTALSRCTRSAAEYLEQRAEFDARSDALKKAKNAAAEQCRLRRGDETKAAEAVQRRHREDEQRRRRAAADAEQRRHREDEQRRRRAAEEARLGAAEEVRRLVSFFKNNYLAAFFSRKM